MKKRRYQLGRRAEAQAETRRRIVEATVKMHEEMGPRSATISAIAEEAGVQRLTVYRHFPDEESLFAACSSHWIGGHPLPDPAIWRSIDDWKPRCRAALAALYTYYRQNQSMLASIFKDADYPPMQAPMQDFAGYFAQVLDDLMAPPPPALAKDGPFRTTLSHALAFPTWQSLAEDLSDENLVDLVMSWLEGVVVQAEDAAETAGAATAGK